MDVSYEMTQFSPLKTPKKSKKTKLEKRIKQEQLSPDLTASNKKNHEKQNRLTDSSDSRASPKSSKRKKPAPDVSLPKIKDIVISMADDTSPNVTPKKARRHKSSPGKRPSEITLCKTEQNGFLNNLDNSFESGIPRSPKDFNSRKGSPDKAHTTNSSEMVDDDSLNIEGSGDDKHSHSLHVARTKISSRKSILKKEHVTDNLTPSSPDRWTSLQSPRRKHKISESPMYEDTQKTSKRVKLSSPTRLDNVSSPEADTQDSGQTTPSRNTAKNTLSYSCPDEFCPFSFENSSQQYITLEDCNPDTCKLFLIKAPFDFQICRIPIKLILNSVQSFSANQTPYEIHSFFDEETSSLTSLVHDSDTGQLKQGPGFVGQVHVMQSLSVPRDPIASPSLESQQVPFPEGLRVRYTPFGAADPVCFSKKHTCRSKSKKKHKKHKHLQTDVTDNVNNSSREKKKKKKKKKHKQSE